MDGVRESRAAKLELVREVWGRGKEDKNLNTSTGCNRGEKEQDVTVMSKVGSIA